MRLVMLLAMPSATRIILFIKLFVRLSNRVGINNLEVPSEIKFFVFEPGLSVA